MKSYRYSPEELAWIKANCTLPRAQMHSAFCAKFGRTDISKANLTALCKRKRWLTGRTGQFVPGQASPNAGKKGQHAAGCEKGWFKKGGIPRSKRPIGYQSIDIYGYVQVCVAETNPWTGAETRMVHLHRRLWETVHGPVPDGHRLKCLDGNKQNTDPANWACIPYALAPRLNGRFGRGYDAAPADLKPIIMATAKLEYAARQAKQQRRTKGGAQ